MATPAPKSKSPKGTKVPPEKSTTATEVKPKESALMKFTAFSSVWCPLEPSPSEGREVLLKAKLREMAFFVVFVIVLVLLTLGMVSPSMYHLNTIIKNYFLQTRFRTTNGIEISYDQIVAVDDFWHYATSVFVDGLYWDYWYDSINPIRPVEENEKGIFFENKIVGRPRIRQLKVRNDSCVIHKYFVRLVRRCYARYSTSSEDTEPIIRDEGGLIWWHHTPKQTGSIDHIGKVASYHGGGYTEDFDHSDRNRTLDLINLLSDKLWITQGTRCIFIDFSVYNSNLNLFCIAKLIFEFPPTGGILPSSSFRTVKLFRYFRPFDYFLLACEIIFICFVLFYTFQEFLKVNALRWNYTKEFWNYIDMALLICSYISIGMGIRLHSTAASSLRRHFHDTTKYANFEVAALLQILYNASIAIVMFLANLKIFKFLSINKRLGQLNNTIRRCAKNIVGFAFMFSIIFFAYAEIGYLMFGNQIEAFAGFGASMFTLVLAVLGDFDYLAIENAYRLIAPIYFLSYTFLVFFLLMNMFLAIINDTYSDVKTDIAISPDKLQMNELLRRAWFNFLGALGCKQISLRGRRGINEFNATLNQIRKVLRRCGFVDEEINNFFIRYGANPKRGSSIFDINKFMTDLERQLYEQIQTESTAHPDYITTEDVIAHHEKLSEIEKSMNNLTQKVRHLLRQLDILESVRKTPKWN